jgi:hypothetical protein
VRGGPAVLLVYRPLRRFLRVQRVEAERLIAADPEWWRLAMAEELKAWRLAWSVRGPGVA